MEARALELAGEEFNLRSPGQLARILFDKLGLPVLSKGKTGPSTSADVLEALADEHEIVRVFLDYRQVHKLKSTYVDALPGLVDPKDRADSHDVSAGDHGHGTALERQPQLAKHPRAHRGGSKGSARRLFPRGLADARRRITARSS